MTNRYNPGNKQSDQGLIEKIRQDLDSKEQALDAATLSRLNQARQRALAQAQGHNNLTQVGGGLFGVVLRHRVIPASALAVTVMLGIVLFHLNRQASLPNSVDPLDFNDLTLLGTDDSVQLYEDLEFIQWLEEQERAATS